MTKDKKKPSIQNLAAVLVFFVYLVVGFTPLLS